MEHRLRVDWIACEGYGLCGDYAPELVELDEWRYPILRPVPITGALADDAQRIVDCCPVRALRLVRESRADTETPGPWWARASDALRERRRRREESRRRGAGRGSAGAGGGVVSRG